MTPVTDPVVITHSDIAAYLRCLRSWAWGYVYDLGIREVEWGALALGSRVHSSIEGFYKDGVDPVKLHDELARRDLDLAMDADAPPWGIDQIYSDMVVGRNCVSGWLMWLEETGADQGLTILGVEEKVEIPILGGRVLLRGKVDRRAQRDSDGAIIIDDYKTTAQWHAGLRERLERSYQHHVYLACARAMFPDLYIAEANYTCIKKSQRNMGFAAVERFRVPGTTRSANWKLQQIEMICEEMLLAIDKVKANPDSAFPSPAESCRWCDFKQPCEVYDDTGRDAASTMLGSLYIQGHKHDRYNKDARP